MTVNVYITMITYQLMHDMTVHDCITINAWQWIYEYVTMNICQWLHDNEYMVMNAQQRLNGNI